MVPSGANRSIISGRVRGQAYLGTLLNPTKKEMLLQVSTLRSEILFHEHHIHFSFSFSRSFAALCLALDRHRRSSISTVVLETRKGCLAQCKTSCGSEHEWCPPVLPRKRSFGASYGCFCVAVLDKRRLFLALISRCRILLVRMQDTPGDGQARPLAPRLPSDQPLTLRGKQLIVVMLKRGTGTNRIPFPNIGHVSRAMYINCLPTWLLTPNIHMHLCHRRRFLSYHPNAAQSFES